MADTKMNYTPEMTAEMVEAYKASPTKATVEMLAEKFGKSIKSVVAKLSREGVYTKAEYVGKTGEKPISKEELVDEIAEFLAVPADVVGDLTKANKATLSRILAKFKADAAAEFAGS